MKSWCAIVVLLLFVFGDGYAAEERYVDIDEEQGEGTHVADVGRILGFRYREMIGRTFRIMTQYLRTENPKSFNYQVEPMLLDGTTGRITLREKLDREKLCKRVEECYIYAVVVTILHNKRLMVNLWIKIVDINDNRPRFEKEKFDMTIHENEYSQGDLISLDGMRAEDDDTGSRGEIRYSLEPKNPYFSITQEDRDGLTGFGLRVLKAPDHEVQSFYKLTVTATDGGDPPLSKSVPLYIRISDANDNAPVFEKKEYLITVPENKPISSILLTVHARDRDGGKYGEVRYFVDPKSMRSSKGLISIDATTGEVKLQRKVTKAEHDKLRIAIEARDSDTERPMIGKAWIQISVEDINDNDPDIDVKFMRHYKNATGCVKESASINEMVALIRATDNDEGKNGEVELEMRTFAHRHEESGTRELTGEFILDDEGLLLTRRRLDREIYQQYTIQIRACDKGSPSKRCTELNITLLVLDINDNEPDFNGQRGTIIVREDREVGKVVTTVQASDRDSLYPPSLWLENDKVGPSRNGIITYSVKGDTNYFSIDAKSGEIRLKKSLDHEDHKSWKLEVTATDGGIPVPRSRTKMIIIRVDDINDNRPVFVTPAKNGSKVYATILKPQPIMLVKASDRDDGKNSKIRYRIVEEDGLTERNGKQRQGLFIINPVSGTLTLNFSKPNISTYLGPHSIGIMASDSADFPLSAYVSLHIEVTDTEIANPLLSSAAFNPVVTVTVISSIVFLILLLVLIVLLVRRRKKKAPHTYNCKTAEEVGRACWISFSNKSKQPNGHNDDDDEKEANQNVYESRPSDRRNDSEVLTPGGEHTENDKMNNSVALSLPIVRSVDMDSGRGDSGSENEESGNSEMGACSLPQSRPMSKASNIVSNRSDVGSTRTSDLGPRCVESCRELGHSDSCWLPSPNEDWFRPHSYSSEASLRYASPTSLPNVPFHYNCIDCEDRRVTDPLLRMPGQRYSVATTEYFQTLPANRSKASDVNYNNRDLELETIAEGVPLGSPSIGGPDTYDVDDVCDVTNSKLSTSSSPRPLGLNAGSATLRPTGKNTAEFNSIEDWKSLRCRSVSCLPGPLHASSYDDISYRLPNHRLAAPGLVHPQHSVYPFVSFSPLSMSNHTQMPLASNRPIVNLSLGQQPPIVADHQRNRPYTNFRQESDDPRTTLLNESSPPDLNRSSSSAATPKKFYNNVYL